MTGIPKEKNGTIDAPISRKEGSIIERCVNEEGDRAITHYNVISVNDKLNISAIKLRLETGRTHQIRVHLAYIGTPILGDTLYGKGSNLIGRQALHSYRTCFIHPVTKQPIEIIAPLLDDMIGLDIKY